MVDFPKSIYIDSCIILYFLQNETGKSEAFSSVLEDLGDIQLLTSTLSVAEVAYYVDRSEAATCEDLERINDFWNERWVTIVEPSSKAMEHGRELIRRIRQNSQSGSFQDIRVRSVDASHWGVARWLDVDECWTYDSGFLKFGEVIEEVKLCEPWTFRPRLM